MSVESVGGGKLQGDRQQSIYMLALEQGSVDVADLARRFAVTTETIRRDLSDLQERKLVRRVHGGAVPVARVNHEPRVDARDMQNAQEKLRLATAAIAEVPERGSMIIDSGSTGQRLAEVLPVDRDLHVVTNSLMTALTLSRRGLRRLTVLGGEVNTDTFAMRDSTALSALDGIGVDLLFISCDGLSLRRGLTTPYREEQAIKRAMIERSDRVVALVDASKFHREEMFVFAELDAIDALYTDTRLEPETAKRLRGLGLAVHRA